MASIRKIRRRDAFRNRIFFGFDDNLKQRAQSRNIPKIYTSAAQSQQQQDNYHLHPKAYRANNQPLK
jgi:hypothetical protein